MQKTNSSNSSPEIDDWRSESLSQTKIRLRRAWGDYPLTILIINPINLLLVRIIGRTSITPNQVSIFSFFLIAIAACYLAQISHFFQAIGALFLLLGYLFDCLDGDLARLKQLKSPFGAMLDPILDRCGEMLIIVAAAVNGWQQHSEPKWLLGGMLLISLSQLYFYITDTMLNPFRKNNNLLNRRPGKKFWGTTVRLGVIEPFVWGQALLSFAGLSYFGIVLFNGMFFFVCIVQFYRLIKATQSTKAIDSQNTGVHVY